MQKFLMSDQLNVNVLQNPNEYTRLCSDHFTKVRVYYLKQLALCNNPHVKTQCIRQFVKGIVMCRHRPTGSIPVTNPAAVFRKFALGLEICIQDQGFVLGLWMLHPSFWVQVEVQIRFTSVTHSLKGRGATVDDVLNRQFFRWYMSAHNGIRL